MLLLAEQTIWSDIGSAGLIVLSAVMSFFLYFLPSIIAIKRKHHQMGAIMVINILGGWTCIGWILAAALSMSATPKPQ